MICAGCMREMEVGDLYIEDDVSGFLKTEANPVVDDVIASLFQGSGEGKIVFCENCTQPGGDYQFRRVEHLEGGDE